MRKRSKFLLLFAILFLAAISAGLNLEPVKAATRKIVYNLKFNDGLVGYWSFNGADMSGVTAIDRSGGGNNGTLNGGAITAVGAFGQALSFDGVDDYVAVSGAAQDGSVSMFAWVYQPSVSNSFCTGSNGCTVITVPGHNIMEIVNGDVSIYGYDWASPAWITTGITLGAKQWHYVGFTYNQTALAIYVDGAQVGGSSAVGMAGTMRSMGALNIGTYDNTGVYRYFNGSIDEVRIYNRALSAGEIAYQYNKTRPDGGATGGGSGTVAKSVANDNGLVGMWDFDDCDTCTTAADRSGNGNTGTMDANLHVMGKTGKGADFNDSSNYIDAGNGSTLGFTSGFSASLWVKSGNNSPWDILLGKDSWNASQGWIIYIPGTGAQVVYQKAGGSSITTPANAVPTGVWRHVVVTNDNGSASIYIDGVLQASGSVAISNAAVNLYIGARHTNDGAATRTDNSDATMDEVRIYNRALSAAEIKNLYNGTRTTFVNIPQKNLVKDGLVGYWSFNGQDMSGVTAYDRSGSGNNGTMTGGAGTVEGVIGQGAQFDGVNDYVNMTTGTGLDFGATTDFSVSFWVKFPDSGGTSFPAFISKGSGSLSNSGDHTAGFVIGYRVDANQLRSFAADGTNISSLPISYTADNVWHHLTVVYNRTGNQVMYLDGASIGSISMSSVGSVTNAGVTLKIGASRDGIEMMTGNIDEVRIYNRAISTAEILQLYNAGKQ